MVQKVRSDREDLSPVRTLPDVRITVIMPAYNEADHIYANVLETAEAMEGIDHEIIVVDDGSADATYEEAVRAARVVNSNGDVNWRGVERRPTQHVTPLGELEQVAGEGPLAGCSRVVVVRSEINHGKGHALRYGFSHATGDLVTFLDADLDLPPFQILQFRQLMQETGADAVIGSKLHRDSKLDYPWSRRIVSVCYYAWVQMLFNLPIHDSQTGLKLFRREVLERVMPRMRVQRFAHDLELLVGAHRFGYSIAEAPVIITSRRSESRPAAVIRSSIDVWMDTLRVFYWASFWKWLSPSAATKLWVIALLLGVASLSFGVAGLLTRAGVPSAFGEVASILFLKFLSTPVRDALLVLLGIVVMGAACVQLNKHVSHAFAKPDEGGLPGIVNVGRASANRKR